MIVTRCRRTTNGRLTKGTCPGAEQLWRLQILRFAYIGEPAHRFKKLGRRCMNAPVRQRNLNPVHG